MGQTAGHAAENRTRRREHVSRTPTSGPAASGSLGGLRQRCMRTLGARDWQRPFRIFFPHQRRENGTAMGYRLPRRVCAAGGAEAPRPPPGEPRTWFLPPSRMMPSIRRAQLERSPVDGEMRMHGAQGGCHGVGNLVRRGGEHPCQGKFAFRETWGRGGVSGRRVPRLQRALLVRGVGLGHREPPG